MIKSIYYITTRPAFTRLYSCKIILCSEKGGIPPSWLFYQANEINKINLVILNCKA